MYYLLYEMDPIKYSRMDKKMLEMGWRVTMNNVQQGRWPGIAEASDPIL